MSDLRYRVGADDDYRSMQPWTGAIAIEDWGDPTSGDLPAILAWVTRGGDRRERAQKIVDALNKLDV